MSETTLEEIRTALSHSGVITLEYIKKLEAEIEVLTMDRDMLSHGSLVAENKRLKDELNRIKPFTAKVVINRSVLERGGIESDPIHINRLLAQSLSEEIAKEIVLDKEEGDHEVTFALNVGVIFPWVI